MTTSEEDIIFGKALYDFEGQRPDNLSFSQGAIITILKQDTTGWWTGSDSKGKVGIFPKNYVELNIDVMDEYPIANALYDFEAEKDEDLGFREGDEITVLKQLNEDWWKGRHEDGRQGIFPSAFVELTDQVDYETAEEEAKKWKEIEDQAKKVLEDMAERRREAEKEMEAEHKALEEANARAADARAKAEAEAASRRKKKAEEESEKARKEQHEINKAREEAEKRHEAARQKLQSVRLDESNARATIKAAEKNRERTKNKPSSPRGPAGGSKQKSAAAGGGGDSNGTGGEEGSAEVKGYMRRRKVNYVPPKENDKFSKLGGGDKCAKCEKAVGLADRVKGPSGAFYHTQCFKCSTCDKPIRGGEYSEHNGFPYCKLCYAKGFGPKGFGYGGAVAQNDQAKERSDSDAVVDSTSGFAAVGGEPPKTYSVRLKEAKEKGTSGKD